MVWLPRWGCDGMITSAQKLLMARAGVKPANFPVIETTSTYTGTAATSHSVTLPSGIVSGDFLLAFYSTDGSDAGYSTNRVDTGWQGVYEQCKRRFRLFL